MIKLFRCTIAIALVCASIVFVLPFQPLQISIDLPAPGGAATSKDIATMGALALMLLAVGTALLAMIGGVGLLYFKRWARPLAVGATIVCVALIALALVATPPFASAWTSVHRASISVGAIAWLIALAMMRAPSVRARFAAR